MKPILNRDATAHGLTRSTLRGGDYVQPVAGASLPTTLRDDLASRCRAAALVLPCDAVFTHITSARLRGWWLPAVELDTMIACTSGEAPHHDRRGVYVRRCQIPPWHRHRIGDVRVASPAWTIVELAEHFALIDLVAVIDGAIHHGATTADEVRDSLVPGRRGVRVLRQALDLCDGRSESPWETYLRLLHDLCGVSVEPQYRVLNRAGVEVARADLHIVGTRRIAEYDGAGHRNRAQHEDDLRREKAIAREDFERYGYIAREILHEPARIIRDADEARGVRHDPTRLGVWDHHIRQSSLSRSGWAALHRRLRRFVRDVSPRSSGAN